MSRLAAIAVVLALSAVPAARAACPLPLAVFSEAQAEAELTFAAPDVVDATQGRFTIRFPENGVTFDGVIMEATEPLTRPWGIVMHKCPEGDVTGAELDACTIWQGVIYGVDELGNVFYLPPLNEEPEAPTTLLLPDFSASVRLSSAWGASGLSSVPKDDFKLSGCQE